MSEIPSEAKSLLDITVSPTLVPSFHLSISGDSGQNMEMTADQMERGRKNSGQLANLTKDLGKQPARPSAERISWRRDKSTSLGPIPQPPTMGASPVILEISHYANNIKFPNVVAQKKSNTQLYRYIQIFLAEVVATAFLLFMVCTGCTKLSNDAVSPVQSSLASGFAVATLVQSFGHVSDCHMNPAVTALFLSLGKIDFMTSLLYVSAELIGASIGYGAVWTLAPINIMNLNMPGHCETMPHPELNNMGAAFIELIITSLLMFMICACLDQRNTHKQDSVPIKFGLVITAISLSTGALTGASMNPARSFGPALWHNQWANQWIYWIAPMSAGLIVPKLYNYFFSKDLTVKSPN